MNGSNSVTRISGANNYSSALDENNDHLIDNNTVIRRLMVILDTHKILILTSVRGHDTVN